MGACKLGDVADARYRWMTILPAQAAEARVLEPDKCEEWIWVPWHDIPRPIFLPLQLLQESDYEPIKWKIDP